MYHHSCYSNGRPPQPAPFLVMCKWPKPRVVTHLQSLQFQQKLNPPHAHDVGGKPARKAPERIPVPRRDGNELVTSPSLQLYERM